jgi:hypothetical protein
MACFIVARMALICEQLSQIPRHPVYFYTQISEQNGPETYFSENTGGKASVRQGYSLSAKQWRSSTAELNNNGSKLSEFIDLTAEDGLVTISPFLVGDQDGPGRRSLRETRCRDVWEV